MRVRGVWAWASAVAMVCGGLLGCEGAGGGPPVAEVRDSAGVRLVANRGRVWTEETAWRVDGLRFEVGGLKVDPEYQVFQVVGATMLGDGRLVVAANGSKTLRFYGPQGTFIRAVGREGSGPGEFGGLFSMRRIRGDSLLIWDNGNIRLSLHDREGSFVRSFKLASGSTGLARFPGPELHAFDDGSFLALEWIGGALMEATPGVFRSTADYFRLDASGEEIGTVGSFPYMEFYIDEEVVEMPNGRSTHRRDMLMFGRDLSLAADDSSLWVGTGDAELSLLDRDGRLLRRVWRADIRRIPVTPALKAEEVDRRLAARAEMGGQAEATLESYRRLAEAMPVADTLPAYDDLLVDESHHLWARRHPGVDGDRAPGSWDVFEPAGRFLGTVELPARFRPFEIGEDYVLGVRTDEVDVEYVSVLPLLKPGDDDPRPPGSG